MDPRPRIESAHFSGSGRFLQTTDNGIFIYGYILHAISCPGGGKGGDQDGWDMSREGKAGRQSAATYRGTFPRPHPPPEDIDGKRRWGRTGGLIDG